MSVSWSVTPTSAFDALVTAYIATIRQGIRQLANSYAPRIEAYMKDNAIWTDRSSNARQTLNAVVNDVIEEMIEIQIAHGMEYGIWLELANAGRYAIINPTIDVFGPLIWADVRTILS